MLQDRVPARPFADIDKALVQELGASAEELFSRFEKGATAAASLAQVGTAGAGRRRGLQARRA